MKSASRILIKSRKNSSPMKSRPNKIQKYKEKVLMKRPPIGKSLLPSSEINLKEQFKIKRISKNNLRLIEKI